MRRFLKRLVQLDYIGSRFKLNVIICNEIFPEKSIVYSTFINKLFTTSHSSITLEFHNMGPAH